MMKKNRFLSFVLALAVTLSSLSGLTAVTASAGNQAPAYDDWTFQEAVYTESFENTTLDTLKESGWSFLRDTGADGTSNFTIRDGGTLSFNWARKAVLSKAEEAGVFYYTYTIETWTDTENQVVRLEGLTDGVLVSSPLAYKAETAYTTVVDTENNKAYTYDADGNLLTKNVIADGERVAALVFEQTENTNGYSFWVCDVSYGIIKDGELPTAAPTAEPTQTPTLTPTAAPTAEPTQTPTLTPTAAPTAEPTQTPTLTPTAAPTAEPTAAPTAEPTLPPTLTPTAAPTAEPTLPPTSTPTAAPAVVPEDGLSYWTLPAASYTEDFSQWVDSSSGLPEYKGSWSLYNGDRSNNTYLMVRNNSAGESVLAMAWHGKATYITAPVSGVYYYTYRINMWNKSNANNVVYLEGLSYGILLESPLADTSEHIFTTIVDADNGRVYTYKEDGGLLNITEVPEGESVTGITFECLDENSAIWLCEFNYGIIEAGTEEPTTVPTDEPTEKPTEEPTPTAKPEGYPTALSYWTLDDAEYTEPFNGSSTDQLEDWIFGNTNGGSFNAKHVTLSENERLEIKWYGSAAYYWAADSGSYYYTYTVRMTDTSGNHTISLEGLTNGIIIDSTAQESGSSAYHTFTTIVDVYSGKAYTYNGDGEFVSEVEIPAKENVSGIKFAALNNTSSSMLIEDFSCGAVNIDIAAPENIKVKSECINGGELLEAGKEYEVTVESFEPTAIVFDAPVAVLADGTAPIYLASSIEIKPASGSFPSGLKAEGTTLTAEETLLSGRYPVSVIVKADCAGQTLLTQTYNITVIKEKITPDDIMTGYTPNVRNEGKTVADNDTVYSSLELPKSNSLMTIEWSSDNAAVIASDGSLTRPLDDSAVTLTAVITSTEDTSKSKTYTIRVNVPGVGAMLRDAIAEAKAAFVSADDESKTMGAAELADLHEDVKLHTEYENKTYTGYEDVVYTYVSDNAALKIADGIAGIYPTEAKKYNAALTIRASIGETAVTEEIPVTVNLTADNAADKYAVRCDDIAPANFAAVANIAGTTVASDVTVPAKGIFGSIISWTSSVPMYLSNTGKYTVPSSTTNAVLTGIVSRGTVISEITHPYTFTLKGKNSTITVSGGGGGGGGGTASSLFTVPITSAAQASASATAWDNTPAKSVIEFADLGTVPWAEEAINALAGKGIVSGKSDSIFAPDDTITRAEFAKIIVNAFGFADDTAETDVFSDVKEDDWYYRFIAAAYANGIINGYDDGTFGVNDEITRQDMAVIIYRAAQKAGIAINEINDEISFDDADLIADYAAAAVRVLQMAGVINGISETEFAPTANATRAQAAKMTYELMK